MLGITDLTTFVIGTIAVVFATLGTEGDSVISMRPAR